MKKRGLWFQQMNTRNVRVLADEEEEGYGSSR
uniref:Uncharacterized protein n=1 Tax=Anguilla anguilla TaxID=7936 RepID=A0A0E9UAB4_ANGAN